ncbi:hypothetical protein KC845_03410, partial [Candidatus Kaiserbacteria bacterium]|nr:hypothetical protein [Candidatus Kaiserbacteria bacterium]
MPKPLLILTLFLLPTITLADSGLVTCTGPDCTICSLITLLNKVIDWIVAISSLLIILVLAYAGFGLVVSGGNQSAYEKAKGYFMNAIIGLIIILAAWTLIDTLMKVLVDDTKFGPWNEIDSSNCGGVRNLAYQHSDGQGNAAALPDEVIENILNDPYANQTPVTSAGMVNTNMTINSVTKVQCESCGGIWSVGSVREDIPPACNNPNPTCLSTAHEIVAENAANLPIVETMWCIFGCSEAIASCEEKEGTVKINAFSIDCTLPPAQGN